MSTSTTSPPASKKPKMSEVPNEKVISLQIGESRFQVRGVTFNKLKNKEGFTVIEGDTYYVDRDGDIFKYILKYLRNKSISFPNDFKDGELLKKEAEFYGLSELKEQFKNGSGKPEIVTLWSMTPEEANSPGIDIFLSWTTSKLATYPVNWETLVKGFLDRLNKFPIRKCKDVVLYSNTAQVFYDCDRKFGDEIEQIERNKCSRFAFNVDNEDVPNTIFTGLLTSGFSLVTDKSSSNVTVFKKAYKSVRELVFQRIKPVNEIKVVNDTDNSSNEIIRD